MKHLRATFCLVLALAAVGLFAMPAAAQGDAKPIDPAEVSAMQSKLAESEDVASSARKKLALRRVIRAGDALLDKHADAPNRFEVLGVLFQARRQLVSLDGSSTNRTALLDTARQLAAAPDEFAAIRLDADLLVSQAELARQGADLEARADALRPLVERYRDTEVEAKVVRVAMLMALEFGDTAVVNQLRQVIAERFPGDLEMINFQRDKLAGQVFGAPFNGQFKSSDGRLYRLPMDGMGKVTGLYFWSKEGDGLEQLKLLAEGWKTVKANPEYNAAARYRFVSFNLDGLPDAGESLLREAGLDWPALHLPDGTESALYKTYVRDTPKLLTMTPTGYTAMVMSGSTRVRPDRGWERSFQSRLARSWAKPRYASQMQSLLAGDFLVIEPLDGFDPANPPELKASRTAESGAAEALARTASSVPEDALRAIQACFVAPPMRYRLTLEEARANYEKADALCRQAIAKHPNADDLWIVRNRRIVALMGLWQCDGDRAHYDAAAKEAEAALEQGYPAGTGLVARFCLAREALRAEDDDLAGVIRAFVESTGDEPTAKPAYAAASLLALEVGDRKLHEHYRRLSLDRYANDPMLWTATAFLLDRYHRYWKYHPPFTAGWTYGRRQGHFLAIGTPEDAERTFRASFKTVEGDAVTLPDESEGKWVVISFVDSAKGHGYLSRYAGPVAEDRPLDDVALYAAVLNEDADAAKDALAEKKKPDGYPTLLVPGGLDNPIARQLGIFGEDTRPNILIVRPDGHIAAALSGLTMSAQHGNVVQNVIEWHDEQAVDDALAKGDLEEAKRLAFTYAPVEQAPPPDAPRNWKPKKITVPHLRARAKVYMAMGQWQAALDDMQAAYLEVNSRAGWLSMRTEDLDETEALRDLIRKKLEQPE
jgi:tetratricopeptide (TPR) repeat protein